MKEVLFYVLKMLMLYFEAKIQMGKKTDSNMLIFDPMLDNV